MAFEFFKKRALGSVKKSKSGKADNPTFTRKSGIFSAFTQKAGIFSAFTQKSGKSSAGSGFINKKVSIFAPKKKEKRDVQMEARRQSIDVLRYAAEHPDDKTALEAADLAQTYLERSLEGSGKKWADDAVAKRYLESKLSSIEGIEEAKKNRLDAFNNNFGLSISEDEWKVIDKIVGSSSFQKMLDVKSQFYDVMYQMVGDAVEQRYNPEKIKDVLDMYWRFDLDPEFSTFKDVLHMNNSDFRQLKQDLYSYEYSMGAGEGMVDFNPLLSSFLKNRK